MQFSPRLAILFGCLAGGATAQFPPTPEGVTLLKSKFDDRVTISYKEVSSCLTRQSSWTRSYLCSAWHLRNDTRREVVLGLYPSASWCP